MPKEDNRHYRNEEGYEWSISDLPYLRKRVTQLENNCLAKDLKYEKLKNKYRAVLRQLRKLLRIMHVDGRTTEKLYGTIPYIETKHIEEDLNKIIHHNNMGRKYYK